MGTYRSIIHVGRFPSFQETAISGILTVGGGGAQKEHLASEIL